MKASEKLLDLLSNLQAWNNTAVFQDGESIISYHNTESVKPEVFVFIDSLKPMAIENTFKAFGVSYMKVYSPTKAEVEASWSGEGKTHGRVYAGRQTSGFIFCFDPQSVK